VLADRLADYVDADLLVVVCRVEAGEALALLQGHGASVRYAAFSPDGQRVLTASADKTARVWDVSTGTELALLQGHEGGVWSAAFSPDGERIVTGSADDSARVWGALPLKTSDTVTYADMAALRILSEAERSSLFLSRSGLSRSTPQPLATSTPNQDCDALAADPLDPHMSGPGLPFETIDPEGAVDACHAAVEAAPSEPRFRYQLGRALARARRLPEAAELYRAAAQQGYPAAVASLGDAYQKGDGVTQDATEAMRLFRQAAEGGFLPAYSKAGWLFWSGAGVAEDREEALRWYEKGAEVGDPFSHRRLAELCERGEQGSQDFEKALFHHAIETELLDAVGEGDEAHVARARRGSDARALAPEVVVRVANGVYRPEGRDPTL
jgi:TPR repeat protein